MDEETLNIYIQELRKLKYLEDDDNIRYKAIIKDKLLKNNKLLFLLNPNKLDDPDSYYNEEIRPYYFISETVTNVKNILCFTITFDEMSSRYSDIVKINNINFYILVDNENKMVNELGICRHDAIASIIKNEFNWSNLFGLQCILTKDEEVMIDQQYVARRLIFETEAPNGIVKTTFGETDDDENYIPYESPVSKVTNNEINK